MDDEVSEEKEATPGAADDEPLENGNFELAMGTGLGALAAGEIAVLGLACPACIVGAPFLLGAGAIKKIRYWQSGIPTE